MEKSIPNKIGLFVVFLFAILPFWAFFSVNFLGRGYAIYTCLIVYFALAMLFYNNFDLKLPVYALVYGLFALYTIFSDRFIAQKPVNFNYFLKNIHLGGFIFLIIIENISITKEFYILIKRISIVIVYIAFFVILIQQFYSVDFFTNPEAEQALNERVALEQRLPSIYSWLGSLASIGLAFFPVLAILLEESFKIKSNKSIVALFVIGAIVAFLNKSRFNMLNYLILLVYIPIYRGLHLGNIFKYSFIVVVATISLYFIAEKAGYDVDQVINERILEKSQGGMLEGSAGSRILAFKVFGQLFPKNPVFGKGKLHGFGEAGSSDYELLRVLHGRSSQIHVGYLSLFYYYGLIGGIIYLIFLYLLTIKLYRDAKKTTYWGPFMAWIMFLLTNWTGVVLEIFIMGTVLAFFFNQYYLQSMENNPQIVKTNNR